MPKVKLGVKHHVTLPKNILEQLKLKPGETLKAYTTDDLGIVLVPTKKIPKDQRSFWTEAGQRRYQEA
ncbi:MAG: AbrB/MazE/SpoVT family DNA-binding domain-containing protein [Nitrospirae bacterium]|nr:AbrB/MazE/SpoVT family DNA-binding domain-containing protein [Nitrospirota bacterium]